MKHIPISPGRYSNLRDGWASAMLIHGKNTDYDIGEQFDFIVQTGGETYMPIEVIVTKIVIMSGEDLGEDEFESLYIQHGWRDVEKMFPKARKEDTFTIVYFDLM